MKKRNYLIGGILAAVFCLVIAILSLANRPACTSERPMGDGGERSFLASVVEQTDTGVLVKPLESETERKALTVSPFVPRIWTHWTCRWEMW